MKVSWCDSDLMKVGYIFALKLNLPNLLHLHHHSLFYETFLKLLLSVVSWPGMCRLLKLFEEHPPDRRSAPTSSRCHRNAADALCREADSWNSETQTTVWNLCL